MKKLAQLALLAFIIIGLSACGKMGELEAVKADNIPALVQAVIPELSILSYNSNNT